MPADTLNIITLHTVKYNDRNSILSAYSLERGPVSLLIPAWNGREANRFRALTCPLSIIECQASTRHGFDILRMSAPRPLVITPRIISDPDRRMIAQFLAELLSVILREGQPDETIFRFLTESIAILDSTKSPTNFHIAFLYRLGDILGIAPDVSTYTPGALFDMLEGRFRPTRPLHRHFLSPDDSSAMYSICRMTFSNMAFYRLSRAERNRILDTILDYYTLHYTSLASLRSLAVLRALF